MEPHGIGFAAGADEIILSLKRSAVGAHHQQPPMDQPEGVFIAIMGRFQNDAALNFAAADCDVRRRTPKAAVRVDLRRVDVIDNGRAVGRGCAQRLTPRAGIRKLTAAVNDQPVFTDAELKGECPGMTERI